MFVKYSDFDDHWFMFVNYSDLDDHSCRGNESSGLSSTGTLMTICAEEMKVHGCQVQ